MSRSNYEAKVILEGVLNSIILLATTQEQLARVAQSTYNKNLALSQQQAFLQAAQLIQAQIVQLDG